MVDYQIIKDHIPKQVWSLMLKWRRMAIINQTTLHLHSVDGKVMNFVYDGFDRIVTKSGDILK